MSVGSSKSARRASVHAAVGLALLGAASAWGCDDGPTTPAPSTPPRAPKNWYCEAAQYAEVANGIASADAICDCACGAYDLDCDVAGVASRIADHARAEDEPDGVLSPPNCGRCVADASAEGASCKP